MWLAIRSLSMLLESFQAKYRWKVSKPHDAFLTQISSLFESLLFCAVAPWTVAFALLDTHACVVLVLK